MWSILIQIRQIITTPDQFSPNGMEYSPQSPPPVMGASMFPDVHDKLKAKSSSPSGDSPRAPEKAHLRALSLDMDHMLERGAKRMARIEARLAWKFPVLILSLDGLSPSP
jgi:hypothetical protein